MIEAGHVDQTLYVYRHKKQEIWLGRAPFQNRPNGISEAKKSEEVLAPIRPRELIKKQRLGPAITPSL
jgi:hypothetical protein